MYNVIQFSLSSVFHSLWLFHNILTLYLVLEIVLHLNNFMFVLCILHFSLPVPSSLRGSRVWIMSWKMLFLISELCRDAQLPSLCSLGLAYQNTNTNTKNVWKKLLHAYSTFLLLHKMMWCVDEKNTLISINQQLSEVIRVHISTPA